MPAASSWAAVWAVTCLPEVNLTPLILRPTQRPLLHWINGSDIKVNVDPPNLSSDEQTDTCRGNKLNRLKSVLSLGCLCLHTTTSLLQTTMCFVWKWPKKRKRKRETHDNILQLALGSHQYFIIQNFSSNCPVKVKFIFLGDDDLTH